LVVGADDLVVMILGKGSWIHHVGNSSALMECCLDPVGMALAEAKVCFSAEMFEVSEA